MYLRSPGWFVAIASDYLCFLIICSFSALLLLFDRCLLHLIFIFFWICGGFVLVLVFFLALFSCLFCWVTVLGFFYLVGVFFLVGGIILGFAMFCRQVLQVKVVSFFKVVSDTALQAPVTLRIVCSQTAKCA